MKWGMCVRLSLCIQPLGPLTLSSPIFQGRWGILVILFFNNNSVIFAKVVFPHPADNYLGNPYHGVHVSA